MAKKNEFFGLILTLLITIIVLIIFGFGLSRLFSNSNQSNQNPKSETSTNKPNNAQAKTFAEVKDVPQGFFPYGGSTTWAPIRKEVDNAITIVYPQFKLVYRDPISGNPGSGTGIKMLLNNQLSFSQSSRSLKTEEYQEAQVKGFKLQEIPVAIDGIAIGVNPNLNIPGLTVSQLKDIYTGKIRNWSEVGGENVPITPYSRTKEAGGTVEFFRDNVMEKEEFGNNVEYVYATTQGLREIINDRGGIYYASAPELVPQCEVKPLAIGNSNNDFVTPYQLPYIPPSQCPNQRNQVNKEAFKSGKYPITRRLFVIVKKNMEENNTREVQLNLDDIAGLKYAELLLTNQGQGLIDKAGFVPLR